MEDRQSVRAEWNAAVVKLIDRWPGREPTEHEVKLQIKLTRCVELLVGLTETLYQKHPTQTPLQALAEFQRVAAQIRESMEP